MARSLHDIIEVLRFMHERWLEDPTLPEDRIPRGIPDALALLYRELGALIEIPSSVDNQGRAPFHAQDQLVAPSRLREVDGCWEFAYENQGNWACRCAVGGGDPPVLSNAPSLFDVDRPGFLEVCPSLEAFMVTLSLQEAVMSARSVACVQGTTFSPVLRGAPELLVEDAPYVDGLRRDFWLVRGAGLVMRLDDALWLAANDVDAKSLVRPGHVVHEIFSTPRA